MVLRRKNVNPNDYVHCCVIGCHGNSLLYFGLNTNISCEGLLGGIQIILKHLYLNDYADFESKISYIMFLHDYHLACEISTVRTLALRSLRKKNTFSIDQHLYVMAMQIIIKLYFFEFFQI